MGSPNGPKFFESEAEDAVWHVERLNESQAILNCLLPVCTDLRTTLEKYTLHSTFQYPSVRSSELAYLVPTDLSLHWAVNVLLNIEEAKKERDQASGVGGQEQLRKFQLCLIS